MPEVNSWVVSNPAIWAESVGGETISLRHPAYPAEAELANNNPETLKRVVAKYLSKVHDALGLPELFLTNSAKFKVHLAWLLLPATGEKLNPRESSRLTRFVDPIHETTPIDHSVLFCASEARDVDNTETILGSRLGIRVTGHLRRKGKAWHLRITSVARSIDLPQALDSRVIVSKNMDDFYAFMFDSVQLNLLRISIRNLAGLSDGTPIAIEGMRAKHRPDATVLAEIYATVSQPDDKPRSFGYALTMRFVFDNNTPISPTVDKFPLVANAAPPVKARIFTQDPASRAGLGGLIEGRPNRSSERLAPFADPVELDGVVLAGGMVRLSDAHGLASVMQSKFVNQGANQAQPELVDPNVGSPRTNPFSALNAYGHVRGQFDDHNLRSLFNTILAYGILPHHYFRAASRPLLVRYRAAIGRGPGKDGKTVNAQVKLDPARGDLIGPANAWQAESLRSLEVRFALADLKRTGARRDALGLAADLRWSWHEYCHVLLAGRTGRLELHFAHSAGDALAAIIADPRSKLANYPSTRGYTFPWVYLHRRHDRSVWQGWSWSGRYHRPNRFVRPDSNCRLKGYESEQILSTSLFRLYRALGGDTTQADGTPDPEARQRAADYTVYLILRAIRLMPSHHVSIVETPDQLVTMLIDADIGTRPTNAGPLALRFGGWAHKVVRWAFEAQGLYATTDPSDMIDAPGRPPPVDIFIENGRPDTDGDFPRGGYEPVSLDWQGAQRRAWHADPNAVRVTGNQIWVQVRNRGQMPAANTIVEVFYTVWPTSMPDPPLFDPRPTRWASLGPSQPRTVQAWPDPGLSFGPFVLPPRPSGTRLLILAVADCTADPANTNSNAGLPCAQDPAPIIDLVAGDNNLGLRVHVVP
jgi:hypothetical protein